VSITHTPQHTFPVGDRFLSPKRGRSIGDLAKGEVSLDELVQMMAGGAELEALEHELGRSE
ncbi:MAG: sugar ABC transporter ATP-binding protein, partial [Mycobacteriales bacterium]